MDSDNAAAIGRLIAKDEIIDLVHRYSYCVDHRLYHEVVGTIHRGLCGRLRTGVSHRAIQGRSPADVRKS